MDHYLPAKEHEKWMRKALREARKGVGSTSPNPAVGCVIVRNDKILGRGFHHRAGSPHAEVMALEEVKNNGFDPKGARVYITLEPCSHYGKTPPCVEALIASGVSEVIFAGADPNPLITGKSEKILTTAGIKVRSGLLINQARELNFPFEKMMLQGFPYLIVKAGMSLDGRICPVDRSKPQITGKRAQKEVQKLRSKADALLIGGGTLRNDNPRLTLREPSPHQEKFPARVVVSSQIPDWKSALFKGENPEQQVILCLSEKISDEQLSPLFRLPHPPKILKFPENPWGGLPLASVLKKLGDLGFYRIMAESGGELNASLFKENLVDEIQLFINPRILGGGLGGTVPWVSGKGYDSIDSAPGFVVRNFSMCGDDFRVVLRKGEWIASCLAG